MYPADDKTLFEAARKALAQLSEADLAMVLAGAMTGDYDMSDDLADLLYENGGDQLAAKLARFAMVSA